MARTSKGTNRGHRKPGFSRYKKSGSDGSGGGKNGNGKGKKDQKEVKQ